MRIGTVVAILAFATTQAWAQSTVLQPGVAVNAELGSDDTHAYELQLGANQFAYGFADQLTVDVVVTVFGPDGERMRRWDGPARGPEMFQFDSDAAGIYRIEITPFERQSGAYSLLIEQVEPVATTPQGRVDQFMVAYDRDDVPGGVVAVMHGDDVAFARAYGMANLSHGLPFTTETVSNIGSVSKQFTAFAIALLDSWGQLSLDDDIRTHFPELPEFAETVTLRHLLNHTGGFREVYNTAPITGWHGEDALYRHEAVRIVQRQSELQTPPGSEFNYNNTGYILLADVVTRVTGTPFPEWMQEHVFGPLGMEHTVVKSTHGQVIPHSAQGYSPVEGGGFRETRDLAASYGAGGIYTTVGDVARWMRNLRDATVGSPEIIEAMTTRAVLTNGDTTSYGLGLSIGEWRGLRRISHGGADISHRAQLMYFPEIDAGVVVLSNNAGFDGSVPGRVASVFFEEHLDDADTEAEDPEPGEGVVVAAEILDAYVGRYEAAIGNLIVEYIRDGDRFYAHPTGQPEFDMIAESDSVFAYDGVPATVTFHREADGTVQRATHHQGGRDVPLTRLPPYAPTPEELAVYAGRYFSAELETYYTLVVVDSSLVAQQRRMEEDITLRPKREDEFNGSAFPVGSVEFIRANDGTVTGFTVSNGRTRGVLFERVP